MQTNTPTGSDDELRKAICKLFYIYEEELRDGVPANFGVEQLEGIMSLLKQDREARELDIRIEEREHEWRMVNDLRYQNISLDFAKEVALERLSKVQVERDMLTPPTSEAQDE